MISSSRAWVCSRTKHRGATVCVPIEKFASAPVVAWLRMLRMKPFAGTGCQKKSPSRGPTILKVVDCATGVSMRLSSQAIVNPARVVPEAAARGYPGPTRRRVDVGPGSPLRFGRDDLERAQTTVRCRAMQVASTSSIGRVHQSSEKISTSTKPAKPGASTAPRMRRQVDHAVAHHAAVVQQVAGRHQPVADVVGEHALAAGARDLRPTAPGPTRRDRRRRATPSPPRARGSSPSQRSSACSSVFTQARSAAYIGCSGSIASGMPAPRAYSSSSRDAVRAPARARRRGPWTAPSRPRDCGRPPTTSTRQGAPSAAASSTARRLSSRARARPARRRPGTCRRGSSPTSSSPASFTAAHGVVEPDRRHLVAPGRDARGCRAGRRPR